MGKGFEIGGDNDGDGDGVGGGGDNEKHDRLSSNDMVEAQVFFAEKNVSSNALHTRTKKIIIIWLYKIEL